MILISTLAYKKRDIAQLNLALSNVDTLLRTVDDLHKQLVSAIDEEKIKQVQKSLEQ